MCDKANSDYIYIYEKILKEFTVREKQIKGRIFEFKVTEERVAGIRKGALLFKV